ncbi:MAG TPA: SBBP repeat-containing protein [Bacteroidia bacterium]|jgi:hypothetical protein|nr:SBBP repeat-containing protein [Bacteroidia bacterium]
MKTTGYLHLLLLSIGILFFKSGSAQSSWLMAKGFANGHDNEVYGGARDTAGNIFEVGFLQYDMDFDTVHVVTAGSASGFIVKMDTACNVLWADGMRNNSSVFIYGICTDQAGNAYVAGSFSGSGFIFGNDTLNSSGFTDMFVAKYDPAGNELWARKAGGNSTDQGYAITADPSGNVYVTGIFQSNVAQFGNLSLNNSGGYDVYLAKYDANGNEVWIRKSGGTRYDWATGVAADEVGDVYLGGYFNSRKFICGNDTIVSPDTAFYEAFIAKYDTAGNCNRITGIPGPSDVLALALMADPSGNAVYTTGYFYGSAFSIGTYSFTGSGGEEALLLKMDSSLSLVWAKAAGGTANAVGRAVALNKNGDLCWSGGFGTVTPGTVVIGSDTFSMPASSSDPAFISLWKPDGTNLCTDDLRTGGDDVVALIPDKFSSALYFASDASLTSPMVVASDTLQGLGEFPFIAKWLCPDELIGIPSLSSTHELFTCYPVPAEEELHVRLNAGEPQQGRIILRNILGETVFIYEFGNSEVELAIPVNDLPPGIYFCALERSGVQVASEEVAVIHD